MWAWYTLLAKLVYNKFTSYDSSSYSICNDVLQLRTCFQGSFNPLQTNHSMNRNVEKSDQSFVEKAPGKFGNWGHWQQPRKIRGQPCQWCKKTTAWVMTMLSKFSWKLPTVPCLQPYLKDLCGSYDFHSTSSDNDSDQEKLSSCHAPFMSFFGSLRRPAVDLKLTTRKQMLKK